MEGKCVCVCVCACVEVLISLVFLFLCPIIIFLCISSVCLCVFLSLPRCSEVTRSGHSSLGRRAENKDKRLSGEVSVCKPFTNLPF